MKLHKLKIKNKLVLAAFAGTLMLSGVAHANQRHFTYAYETGVLPVGEREVELWSTYRTGRHELYSRMDHRAEFEFGLTERLMTAFYLNWQTVSQEDRSNTPSTINTQSEFTGISSEWKYKLSDPVADRIGSALYGEFTLGTNEIELEAKAIFDKRFGKNLVAYNFVVEGEWEREPGELEYEETALENVFSFNHFFRPHFGAGFELRNHNEFTSAHKPEHSALFLGPVISYAQQKWWVAFTALAQLPAIKRSAKDRSSGLILDEHERYNARLLLGFDF